MKVIMAGYNKTGTKSMSAAFRQLGYTVFDFMESFYLHRDEWDEIYSKGGSTELFRRMYENIDVVVDMPAFYFWKEIHEAFPEAKIILTIRDNEDSWVKSFAHQLRTTNGNMMYNFARTVTPTGRRATDTIRHSRPVMYGVLMPHNWSGYQINETILKIKYREHNADVLQNAPKDKLLVFRVQEGWEPLCKFLGVDVPDIPFPHKNIKGCLHQDQAQNNPIMMKMLFEAKVALFLLVSLGAILVPVCFIAFGN